MNAVTLADRLAGKGNGKRPTAATLLRSTLLALQIFIRRYVVLNDHQAVVLVLWVAHTHAIDAADCTPYLQITSATKRAGKTRLLEVLETVVARPWLTGRMSAAVLIRKVDAERPTLLLDESDAAFSGEKEYAEALRGILNTGYRRSGKASLCVGQGASINYRDFSTFGAKAIAGIGELPGTIGDRALQIELRRRTSDEPCTRWRDRDGHAAAEPIHQQLVDWAGRTNVLNALRKDRPALPDRLDDRKADVWEPLLAIADMAGSEWPERARQAALALAGAAEDTDIVVELLRDVAEILKDQASTIVTTKDLLSQLTALEDRPWAVWRHDKPITGRGMARLLGPLGIHPDRHQAEVGRIRGYRCDAFTDAIARYLPLQVSMCPEPNRTREVQHISTCPEAQAEDRLKFENSPDFIGAGTHGQQNPQGSGTGADERL
jgi:hypothetical protein